MNHPLQLRVRMGAPLPGPFWSLALNPAHFQCRSETGVPLPPNASVPCY